MRIRSGGSAEAVLQGAQRVLFVEGETTAGLDVQVLRELIPAGLRVERFGSRSRTECFCSADGSSARSKSTY